MAIVAMSAIRARPTMVSHHQLLDRKVSSPPKLGGGAAAAKVVVVVGGVVVATGAAVVVVVEGAVVVVVVVVVVVDVVVVEVVVVVSGGNVVVVVVVVVVGGGAVVVGARVVVVVVVVVVVLVVVVVGVIATCMVQESTVPGPSMTCTEPLPDAPEATLIDTVADHVPPPSCDPETLALATPDVDPMYAKALCSEEKLTVTERLPPSGMLTPGHDVIVASAVVTVVSVKPTAESSSKRAITTG
jgi:hypothetical protein